MDPSCVVVVGASAGGVESLTSFVRGIPAGFSGAVLVVLHLAPDSESRLPEILTRSGALPAVHPHHDEEIAAGRIYVAPPDHHLLVDGKRIQLTKGPKENRFRPSIDALFRSAAYTYGARAIGVILSGALDDGTSGLWAIKRLGGTAVVQAPDDAQFDSMPLNAMKHVQADYFLRASEMGAVITQLAAQERFDHAANAAAAAKADVERIAAEVKIASSGNAFQHGILNFGELTPFTCPECHGVLVKLNEDGLSKFRCHIGHAYSTSALLAGITDFVGHNLWQTARALDECVMLLAESQQRHEAQGDAGGAKHLAAQAMETEAIARALQRAALAHKNLSEERITKAGRKS